MNAAAILAALWPAFRKVALRIGRWLLDVVVEEGVKGLAIYMRQRVKVFHRRLARVRKRNARRGRVNWRERWLKARIARWRKALAWLDSKQAAKLKGKVIDLAVERAKREIPEAPPDEIFKRWRRKARSK